MGCFIIMAPIVLLIIWKIIYNFTIMLLFIPLGLFVILVGKFFYEETRIVGILVILVGIAMIVLSIIHRDLSVGVMIDSIPYWLGILKKTE